MGVPTPGHWVYSEEAQTVKFVSHSQAEDSGVKIRRQTNAHVIELQQRSEWLADVCVSNRRGRHNTKKSLSHTHLNAYRTSVMTRQTDFITIDDIKQVAVCFLQKNYTCPIPFCFLAMLKSKELDDTLTALVLYMSCFFEYKSLEKKPKASMVLESLTEQRMKAKALAKKELAQKKLALSYFNLIIDLEKEQNRHARGRVSFNNKEWLLDACLYSFFCYVAWVTFGRKDLGVIQEEVGRLLYSDSFNTTVRRRTDGDMKTTSAKVNGSVKKAEAEPKDKGCSAPWRNRASQRVSSVSSIVNQRSPLMVTLLPSSKERSPHLFVHSSARKQSRPQVEHIDTKALTEELNQQLASGSIGILRKPFRQFCHVTLLPHGEQENSSDDDGDREVNNDGYNISEDARVCPS